MSESSAPRPPKKPKHTSTRTCAATGTEGPPTQFLRFVQGPQNGQGHTAPWPDFSGKLPGRGLYLTPTLAAYTLALKKKAFARQLDTNQPPPPWPELAEKLQAEALQRLSLAKKAGQLVLGTDNVLESARQGVLQAVLLAVDAAADTQAKITAAAARHTLPLLVHFHKDQLDQALGQANAVVAGFTRLDTAWPSVHKARQASP